MLIDSELSILQAYEQYGFSRFRDYCRRYREILRVDKWECSVDNVSKLKEYYKTDEWLYYIEMADGEVIGKGRQKISGMYKNNKKRLGLI